MAITFAFLICALGLMTVNAKDPVKSGQICEEPTTHYLELGCKPIYSSSNGMCPVRYECPFMKRTVNAEKCYYKSLEFSDNERLGKGVVEHSCSVECICSEGYDRRASITCAQIECPELFNERDPEKEHCIKQYKMKDCCSHNEICDKKVIEELKKCEWDGKMYREGEKFYPSGTCKQCICNKEFDGTLNSLHCTKINCGIEIYHGNHVNDKCAPIYLESRPCCPIGWKCSDEEYSLSRVAARSHPNPDMKCTFDDKPLEIGDKVVIEDDECVKCTCNIPPLVTCIRSLNC